MKKRHRTTVVPRVGARVSEIEVTRQLLPLDLRRIPERLIAQDAVRRGIMPMWCARSPWVLRRRPASPLIA